MAGLKDLKISQPEALAEFKTEVLAEHAAGEADRTKAACDKAVAEALAAKAAEKPAPATRAELKLIVPETMSNREALIGSIQDENATAEVARARVMGQLVEENKTLATRITELEKVNKGLGGNGLGTNPLNFNPSDGAKAGKFEQVVLAIKDREKCDMQTAIGKACNDKANSEARLDWVARGQPDIKAA